MGGDHAVMLAYATPARGTVLLPVTNFAVRDREAGTSTAVNSSVGMWKKLERIRRDPHVALAFHTREHAYDRAPRVRAGAGQGHARRSGAGLPDEHPRALGAHRAVERPRPWLEVVDARLRAPGGGRDRRRARGGLAGPPLRGRAGGARRSATRPARVAAAAEGRHRPADSTTSARRAGLRPCPTCCSAGSGPTGSPMVVPVGIAGTEPGGIRPGGGRRAAAARRAPRRLLRPLVQQGRDRPEPAQAHGLARRHAVRAAHSGQPQVSGLAAAVQLRVGRGRRDAACAARARAGFIR